MSSDDSGVTDAGDDDELWVEDTLGWRVRFVCDGARCRAPESDAPPDHPVSCPDDLRPYVGTTIEGRVPTMLATCAHDDGWYGWAEVARPIVCRSDASCERLQHVSDHRLRCVDGLCQVPEDPLDRSDVVALCIASVPRPTTALYYRPSAGEEHAFDLADAFCPRGGDVCELPPECAPH